MKNEILKFITVSVVGCSAFFGGNVHALTVTSVSASSSTITVTGTCTVNAGNTSIWYKLQGSGPNFNQLANGTNNCANGNLKTKTISHTLPSGTYKIRLIQSSNMITWPTPLIW